MKKTLLGLIVIILIAAGVWYFLNAKQSPVQSSQPISTFLYACNGGKTINASFYEGESKPAPSADQPPIPGGSAKLTFGDDSTMTLNQTISADGARYANADESFVFWSKGNGAMVLENNQEKNYIGCIVVVAQPAGSDLSKVYANSADGFSLRLPSIAVATSSGGIPDSYSVDESYQYQELGPGKDINGVKFTIPASIAQGTNLGADSYLSVEQIPQIQDCSAKLFLDGVASSSTLTEGDMTYSFASTTGAGAGNRYEESVYALPGTNPCTAVRYFVHYGVIENYPAGSVKQFDRQSLLSEFDAIRKTLVISQ